MLEKLASDVDLKRESNDWYFGIAYSCGLLAFICAWIYAIYAYGFFLGVSLGRIPAFFFAVIIGFLWPVIAAASALVILIHLW